MVPRERLVVATRLPNTAAPYARLVASQRKWLILLVRAGRLELPRPLGQQILSLPRLPFRHARRQSRKHILPLIKDVHIGVTAQSAGGFDTGSLAR